MSMVYDIETETYFTSRASAIMPAAKGADAEVPVCLTVQSLYKSVVACKPSAYIILKTGQMTLLQSFDLYKLQKNTSQPE